MPQPAPDRPLRRMVADLAALHAEDIAKILNELAPDERKVVEGLLHDYVSPPAMVEPTVEMPPAPSIEPIAYDASKLSAWLAHRLEAAEQPGYEVTPKVRLALRECVARVYPLPEASPRTRWRRRKARKPTQPQQAA